MAQDDPESDPNVDEPAATDEGPADIGPGPIRALTRGLEVLQALNATPSASVTEIARAIGLPRTTTYRVLETLCAGGFAARAADERYRLQDSVRRLADGYDDEVWIGRVARPAAAALAKDLPWPLTLATLHGTCLKAHRLDAAQVPERVSLTTSAAGRAYLAALSDQSRAAWTAIARDAPPAPVQEQDVHLAVPVLVGGVPVAALAVAVPRSALPQDQAEAATDRITGLLAAAAAEIAAKL